MFMILTDGDDGRRGVLDLKNHGITVIAGGGDNRVAELFFVKVSDLAHTVARDHFGNIIAHRAADTDDFRVRISEFFQAGGQIF